MSVTKEAFLEHLLFKADLHVHSRFSTRPSEWVLRKIGCAESYTEPGRLYALARERGMDLVTITDHNALDGCLEIADLPGVFLSEEVTTYFPEDGCKLHVLAYGITEGHHREISRLRENVFDLVPYLRGEGIVHALAHPLYPVNDRLTPEHLDKALLLFKLFEINGSRSPHHNQILREILGLLTPETMERLADRTGIDPVDPEPWKKVLVGGSDDHSSLDIGRMHTQVPCSGSPEAFLQGLVAGEGAPRGESSSPIGMAHHLYGIAYQFYSKKFRLGRYITREPLLHFAHIALSRDPVEGENGMVERLLSAVKGIGGPSKRLEGAIPLKDLLRLGAREVLGAHPALHQVLKGAGPRQEGMGDLWYTFVDEVSNKVMARLADTILTSLSGADLFDIFATLGSAGSLYTMLAPYFVAYGMFSKSRGFCGRCLERFSPGDKETGDGAVRVAHFTDTFDAINGVALTLQSHVELALKHGKDQTILTCGREMDRKGVMTFPAIGSFAFPEYPNFSIPYPPLLSMLDACYRERFTQIHVATPGPVGLAALAIARILGLPICGTYHTALPQYAEVLTDDPALEELTWRYMLWFYGQMDWVYVPSRFTGQELARRGLPEGKIRLYPRGIDVERFHPMKRNGFFAGRFGIGTQTTKLLYVGRVSQEKELPLLGEVFRALHRRRQDIHLIVVGDGPYLPEMRRTLADLPVTFTGLLMGEDLPQAYASADLFLFPSQTDTFGNVVLEAQASGLPVVVVDKGGPQENLIPGKTGIVVPAGDPGAFLDAVLQILDNPSDMQEKGLLARRHMEGRSLESAYLELWESYGSLYRRAEGAPGRATERR